MGLLDSHWIGVAAGWASLFAAIYFFCLAWGAGKQKAMMLHGVVDEPPANRLERASARYGRIERRGRRFLIVFFIVTFLLVATFV